jgi:aminomethyltransferase
LNRTPLYERHRALGARFVDFGGWEMPVQYTGILEEHHAVRQRAGLFDVSHMGQVEVRGPRALATVQRLTVNDVARLQDGQAQYSLLCHPTGGVIDDIIVYRLTAQRILICINAANIEKDLGWIREHNGGAEIVDRSSELALLALQGPQATAILAPLVGSEITAVARFACCESKLVGREVLLARTGYTGEDGWEIYCRAEDAVELWDSLLAAGSSHGLAPAGLGARDTLRLEAALPLYGHELADDITPLEAGLSWVVRLDKGEFIGRDALRRKKDQGVDRQLVGVVLTEPGIPRQGYAIRHGDEVVGSITSGTKSPTLGKGIGLGYAKSTYARVGTSLSIDIRGRQVRAEVVARPFYKRRG